MEIQKRLCGLLLGDVPKDFFKSNRERLQAENLSALRWAVCAGAALCGAVGFGSLAVSALRPVSRVYLALCGLNVLGILLAFWVLPRRRGAIRPVLYAYILLWDAAALLLGTLYMPQDTAAAFFITTLVTAVLVLDRPIYPMLITLGVHLAFCLLVSYWKAPYPEIMQMDYLDSFYSLILSLFFCGYLIRLRLKNLQSVQLFCARSETDALTGLSNKQAIDTLCRAYLSPARAEGCALILLDIDDFKQINDAQGSSVGDEVLHSVGLTMRAMFREEDIVGRFGGDEFLVLMKNISDRQDARLKAERLHGRIADIVTYGRPLACSIGVALAAPGEAIPFEKLFSQADMALYSSKTNGKDTVTFYCPLGNEASPAASAT